MIFEVTEAVFSSTIGLCSELSEDEFGYPTAVPGWDVKDNLSHLVAIEHYTAGDPPTTHVAEKRDWVKNPLGEYNENEIDSRRSLSGAEVLEQFKAITDRRLEQIGSYTTAELDEEVDTPLGRRPRSEFLWIRVVDLWVHEQDIRRALFRPGHMTDGAAPHVLNRFAQSMSMVLGKKAAAPEGTTLDLEILGIGTFGYTVSGGRGTMTDEPNGRPDLSMTLDVETFTALACGRWDPVTAFENGRITWAGDAGLLRRFLQGMNIMF